MSKRELKHTLLLNFMHNLKTKQFMTAPIGTPYQRLYVSLDNISVLTAP